MVDAPGAPPSTLAVGNLSNLEIASRAPASDLETGPAVLLTDVDESEHTREKARCESEIALPQTHRVQTAYLLLDGNRAVPPRSKLTVVSGFVKRKRQFVRIGEGNHSSSASRLDLADGEMVFGQPLRPVIGTTNGNGE